MMVKICGCRKWLWRAIDNESEVLDILLQRRRNKAMALKLLWKLPRSQGVHPEAIVTEQLASYRSAAHEAWAAANVAA